MLFSSISFLYFFLPIVLAVYFITPKQARNYVLLIMSLIFYFFGEPVYTVLLIFSSLFDYLHSLYIEKKRGTHAAKIALISSIVINLAMLGFFKYADFLITSVNGVFGLTIPLLGIALPIGISFFTFQTMSYTIDVYRGKVHAERNFATLATFVCLFPQLIAGPIVRYSDIAAELRADDGAGRSARLTDVSDGLRRFVMGLGKKVLIANACGELCGVFRASDEKTVLFYWIYAVAFTLQIYFDFSGYSDMAIGLGRVFGFTFPENFNYLYLSRSITEFWRRWHMTLGGWFRDYIYIPLGGNRVSKGKWLRNICIVWMLTGLWHGAAWNFVLWGLFFGLMLMIEKLWLGKLLDKAPEFMRHIYVMVLIILSFVLFNADGFTGAIEDFSGLFAFGKLPFFNMFTLYTLNSYAVLLIVSAIGAMPLAKHAWMWLRERPAGAKVLTVLEPVALAVVLLIVTAYLIDGSFNPFLYFRF
ncbi:MAG: MBOAT family O-acyltransferase [Clostridiaceae bacterium]|nr:MBOAT family O-acyltransferase [Clostridiaceae bacterium]